MKKRLLLVSPRRCDASYDGFTDRIRSVVEESGRLLIASLATVAALVPPEFDVAIVDENVEPIDFDGTYDLVGITSFPSQLYRAEEIAREFSRRGVLVICGGSSVSLSPERWRSFSDVLIVGEAERIWPRFLRDYLAGSHEAEYRETERFDLSITPVPDYSGYSKECLESYSMGIVQTSRGCPFNCEFCDAIVYSGRRTRYKPIETILREVENLQRMGMGRQILLSDDNFVGSRSKAKEILAALRDWNRRQARPVAFHTQLTIDCASDDEFLELAAEAGLARVYTGIETPNVESLKETQKRPNINTDMLQAIQKFHLHGIQIMSGAIVGFDHDDLSIFQRQLDFFMQSGIAVVRVAPLEVLDGTRLKERMVREGRYIDWEDRGRAGPKTINELDDITFVPKQMTIEQLKQGIYWLLWQLYNPDNFVERFRSFFARYEGSPKKDQLTVPRAGLEKKMVGFLGRFLKYILIQSTRAERDAFWKMFRCAGRSSHPRRFMILFVDFLEFINTRQKLCEWYPTIAEIGYPS
jgi:radical SAM superfamily enzyme YgiQ (UPF0313 family)